MPRSFHSFNFWHRAFSSALPTPSLITQRIPGAQRCIQAAVHLQKNPEILPTPQKQVPRQSYHDDLDSRGMSTIHGRNLASNTHAEPQKTEDHPSFRGDSEHLPQQGSQFAVHLNGVFSPLQFPPELARRILTHGSHPAAIHGHNAGLTFMGRRVLEAYLLLFLNSSSALTPRHDLEHIVSCTLNTYKLGEHVAPVWGLGRVLRWTPTIPAAKLEDPEHDQVMLRSVGLYKVQGDAVSAVMGGIFDRFGGSVANRVFHTRLLPHLLEEKADVLPHAFHSDVLATAERMGGSEGPLLPSSESSSSLAHAGI